ncbi:MAG TPA: DUF3302 domain-containing protein [Amaricoccus sp.]|uniref:DUF3302 domain-containing protein n=1 Tax=Amaricoccus sp. TaxID=1872485 RepID=UPI002D0A16F1|nr:DUF3302 domain-containing protein [Amaricoccus sp.]HMQ92189.1 DUF3302 domain-containing protein [Amaricoccus sp.]HMR52610.1 DUF3302 domain-containing protein [Amaricoccus sp.]HMR59606.1 DUF3302 domain-containing protein [Amaricoccus sp.]HMT99618.1 DUF3302 domain-containing protein [Amaricoccus sp.]
MDLIGRPLDYYDYLTFLALVLLLLAAMAILIFLMGLPGRIAIKRNHPHAESVRIMGYMGFLVVVPWVHAFLWAFHDSATVDIRRFPDEEKDVIRREIARLRGEPEEPPSSPAAGEAPPPQASA